MSCANYLSVSPRRDDTSVRIERGKIILGLCKNHTIISYFINITRTTLVRSFKFFENFFSIFFCTSSIDFRYLKVHNIFIISFITYFIVHLPPLKPSSKPHCSYMTLDTLRYTTRPAFGPFGKITPNHKKLRPNCEYGIITFDLECVLQYFLIQIHKGIFASILGTDHMTKHTFQV